MPTRPSTPAHPAADPARPIASRPHRTPARLVALGGLGVAVTTALEVLTAPYSPAVRAYPVNGAVHTAKVIAVVAFVAGVLMLAARLREPLGRLGSAAMAVVGLATVGGAVPYSLVEAFLDPSLPPAEADQRLEAIYAEQTWIAGVSTVALPLVLVGLVTLAVVALRRRLVPAWAPIASLVALPVAVLAGIAGEAGLPIPHPPAWLFLGLSAYGIALLRTPTAIGARSPVPA
ncbi:hypothetical protein GCM10010531_12990 [Blastococcus jejuensis]|uniref:MYXO-CTERM domain-containing protein n=1 Tax=Blastococcus jejuensis TaxID=351224 RepID=A0ABP6NZL3_9ACTN